MYVCMYVCMYILYACMYVWLYVCMCMVVYMYGCMYVWYHLRRVSSYRAVTATIDGCIPCCAVHGSISGQS